MARDEDELLHAEENDNGKPRSAGAKIIVVGIVLAFLVYQGYSQLTGDDQSTASADGQGADQTTRYDPERADARRQEDQDARQSVDEAFSVDEGTRESEVRAVDLRINSTNEQVQELKQELADERKNSERTLARLENRLDEKLGRLTSALRENQGREILEERDRSIDGGESNAPGRSNGSGLPMLGEDDGQGGDSADPTNQSKQKPSSDSDFPYMELGASSNAGGDGFSLPRPGGGDNTPGNQRAQSRNASTGTPPPPPAESSSDAASGASPSPLDEDSSGGDGAKSDYASKTIPGSSWVHVTDLHGVACPVGNSVTSNNNNGPQALINKVPVTLPIRGDFHGPNGTTYSLGAAHVSGTCVGQESNRPSAIIKIERLSYVGPDGEPQFIPVNGYLIDRRDNQMGIAGYLDTSSGRDIALSAIAAGFSAAGEIFSDSQFDTSLFTGAGAGANAGAARSIDGSNIPQAVAGDAFGAAAGRIADYYAEQANRTIPVVRIRGGLPITMITTAPFEYLKKQSNSDVAYVD